MTNKMLNWINRYWDLGRRELNATDVPSKYPCVYVRPGDESRGFYAEVIVYFPGDPPKHYDLNLGCTLTVDFSPPKSTLEKK